MKILNHTQNYLFADKARLADSFRSRLVGLLDRKEIVPGEALVITHCQQVHMFFMKFAIDVIFIDRAEVVVGLVENIKPFSMSPIFLKAHRAIELPAGTISHSRTSLGDSIQFLSS